jgi:uncharacterized protein YjiS (DUF1127 family)
MMNKFTNWLRARSVYSVTLKELSRLSDRELDDMGLSRECIHEIARSAAQGATQ